MRRNVVPRGSVVRAQLKQNRLDPGCFLQTTCLPKWLFSLPKPVLISTLGTLGAQNQLILSLSENCRLFESWGTEAALVLPCCSCRKKCDASYLLCPEHSKLKRAPCSHTWQRSRVPKQLWLLHITHVNIWGWSSSTALKLPGSVYHTCDVCALTQAQLSKCTAHVAPQVCVLVLATDECLHWEILTLLCSEVHVRTGWQWEKQPVRKNHRPLPWHFESACIPTVSAHLDAVKYRYMIKKAFQMDGWLMRSMMITSIYYSTGHSVWEMTGSKWPLLHKNFNREGATTSDLHCSWQDLHREFKPQACGARLCDEPLLLKCGFFGVLQFLVNFAMLEKMNHYLILTISQLALWKQWCICHPSCSWLVVLPSEHLISWWDFFLAYYSHGSFFFFLFLVDVPKRVFQDVFYSLTVRICLQQK